MTERLLEQVKRKLNITWDDEGTNKRIEDIVQSAIPDMIHMLGIADAAFDFSEEGAENTLFLAYCLYEFNHSLHEFADNYANKIMQVRAMHEVEYYRNSGDIDE